MITVIDFLRGIIKPHLWYAADIDALNAIPSKLDINSSFLRKIGDDLSLIEICSKINQFLSGVFLAVDNQNSEEIGNLQVGTEDEQFRSLDIKEVIRAFDTSFFELYSKDENIIKKLAKRFGAKTINKENFKPKQVNE